MKTGPKQTLKCKQPPSGVQFKKGRWVYRYHRKNLPRKEISLKDGKQLLREDTPCSVLHLIVENLDRQPQRTISYLLDMYLESPHGKSLSPSTLEGYAHYYKTITSQEMTNDKTLGEMPFELVTKGLIRTYLDFRATQGATTGANREIELLSAAYNWACERDYAKDNPCKGVRHHKEQSKQVYITDEQYYSLLKIVENTPLYFACEIAYLSRARGVEAWNVKLEDINNDKGIFIPRTKGSLPEWTIWTPRLRAVIDEALKLRANTQKEILAKNKPVPLCNYLIITKDGNPYSKNARDSIWQRAYKKLVAINMASMEKSKRFSFHDIKAKGVSDHELNESGHKSEKAKAVYLRKTKEVKATK